MAKLAGLVGIVAELRAERTNLLNQLQHVDAALSVLGKLDGGSSYTAPNRRMSSAARKKISLAQNARWAKSAANRGLGAVQPKRVISASARRKMAAGQKKRWAAFRAAKKSK